MIFYFAVEIEGKSARGFPGLVPDRCNLHPPAIGVPSQVITSTHSQKFRASPSPRTHSPHPTAPPTYPVLPQAGTALLQLPPAECQGEKILLGSQLCPKPPEQRSPDASPPSPVPSGSPSPLNHRPMTVTEFLLALPRNRSCGPRRRGPGARLAPGRG